MGKRIRTHRLTDSALSSGLVRGLPLAGIGAEYGVSKQAIHQRVKAFARSLGLTLAELRDCVDDVLASERCDRLPRFAPAHNDGRIRRPAPSVASFAELELDRLGDEFAAGQWTERKHAAAIRAERIVLSYSR